MQDLTPHLPMTREARAKAKERKASARDRKEPLQCRVSCVENGTRMQRVSQFVLPSTPAKVAVRRASKQVIVARKVTTFVRSLDASSRMLFMSMAASDLEFSSARDRGLVCMWDKLGC